MKILVTGSSGFIGSHLVDRYVEEGHEVICIDERNMPFKRNPKANYQNDDLVSISSKKLNEIVNSVDVINHHAAQVDLRASLKDPVDDANNNIIASLKLLEAAVKQNIKTFIFASSGGAIDDGQPQSPYGIAKLTIEHYLEFYKNYHNMNTIALRYSNVYGPRQTSGVIPIFIDKMVKQQPLVVNGGRQTRDFVYIDDVIEANVVALSSKSGVFNISTGRETTVSDLAQMVIKEYRAIHPCNFCPSIQYHNYIQGEVMNSVQKPTETLNWSPKTSLNAGLRKIISSL